MKPISAVRFDAIAGYARRPMARIAADELAWYEHGDGVVVGALIRDRQDSDYSGLVFARDEKLRFRCVNVTAFRTSIRRVEIDLRRAMEEAALAAPEAHHQGDAKGPPIDFFTFTRPRDRLHVDFVKLAEMHGYVSARQIIEPMMRWYDDADGNFVEQFQTTGFDQRIWELYLFAAFTEMGYDLTRRSAVPDFDLQGPYGPVAVEAVTVAPSQGGRMDPQPDTSTEAGKHAYLREYMPIKFGSPLFSKLMKRYWEQAHIAGKPLVFAIEDFSSPGSMTLTRAGLIRYLTGYEHESSHAEDGSLSISPRKIVEHRWGTKVIPSGFFNQPDAEHVSAVIFSNSGTIAKFNRMGVVAGFGAPDVVLVREGVALNHDPNASEPTPFTHVVNHPQYTENWVEGLEVFHNPNALYPLAEDAIPGAAHHQLQPDGGVISTSPLWSPLSSRTQIFDGMPVDAFLQSLRDREAQVNGPADPHGHIQHI